MANSTTEISTTDQFWHSTNGSHDKGETPIHLESVNKNPGVPFDDIKSASQTNPYVSDDPKDPDNWPVWKKNTQILMVSAHSMVATFMAAGIVPASDTFTEQYGVSAPKASYLVSAQVSIPTHCQPISWRQPGILTLLTDMNHVDPPARNSSAPLERHNSQIWPLPCPIILCLRKHGLQHWWCSMRIVRRPNDNSSINRILNISANWHWKWNSD